MPLAPFVNLDDPVENGGKIVGRRKPGTDSWKRGMQAQKAASDFLRAFELRGHPKGVFRFRTFEEANEWDLKFLIGRRRS